MLAALAHHCYFRLTASPRLPCLPHCCVPILQLTMFDTPMSTRQLEYLRKTHASLIAKHNITQAHYDLMLGYLTEAMAGNGAEVRVPDSLVLQPLLEGAILMRCVLAPCGAKVIALRRKLPYVQAACVSTHQQLC